MPHSLCRAGQQAEHHDQQRRRRPCRSPSRGRCGTWSTRRAAAARSRRARRQLRSGTGRDRRAAHGAARLGGAELDRVAGQLHVGLLERRPVRGHLGERHAALRRAAATIRSAASPETVSVSGPVTATVAPGAGQHGHRLGAGGRCGAVTRPPDAAAISSATLVSATTRPRPTTTRWSAVSCSSLIRWLETRTARPSAASERRKPAHPHDALGVQAVERLVEHQHRRVAEQRGGDAEPLAHAERVAARLAPGRRAPARPARSPRRPGWPPEPWEWASHSRWLRAVRLGCSAPASSSAPTWLQRVAQARGTGWPPISAVPSSAASRPRITRIVVDLPAPLGPTKPVTWPGRDREGHPVQGHGRPEPLAQAGDFDGRFHAGNARQPGRSGRHAGEPIFAVARAGDVRPASLVRGMADRLAEATRPRGPAATMTDVVGARGWARGRRAPAAVAAARDRAPCAVAALGGSRVAEAIAPAVGRASVPSALLVAAGAARAGHHLPLALLRPAGRRGRGRRRPACCRWRCSSTLTVAGAGRLLIAAVPARPRGSPAGLRRRSPSRPAVPVPGAGAGRSGPRDVRGRRR